MHFKREKPITPGQHFMRVALVKGLNQTSPLHPSIATGLRLYLHLTAVRANVLCARAYATRGTSVPTPGKESLQSDRGGHSRAPKNQKTGEICGKDVEWSPEIYPWIICGFIMESSAEMRRNGTGRLSFSPLAACIAAFHFSGGSLRHFHQLD